ncbi:type IV secretion system DNA-binding domain-containing protein [Phocaeicola vulgatus]|uniref:Type IV secretion system DNA-binding domain-containing protein n=5 Tax=Bacteroidales TaxID=171549 RepID=A0A6I1BJ68_PHOVU|nr:conjugal transfer protein MobC [Phocaeicola vulgatus]KAB3549783.1 type IV secretion system DNA-binding domain-containing protein [Phocaeicola vulgatus]KAB3550442.1 type IV secretion system DNA-binding domain-containing protein [Phocaeicola vulgatus]KAB3550575.1 type IV secretion system DNA-binding domain-containing protein [Phocaeicola vulgatus]KAB3562671.1 type IV secretion system DNA-binding domain-containing protein [Phocaeicola vulgatus]KAB3574756.1 type IV secretion system DNA-binding 
MQQEDDLRALAKIMEFGRAVSIFLLVVHVYVYCYPSITAWNLNLAVMDRILVNFNNTTGIFNCILWSKLLAVLLLAVSCLGTHGVKGEKITWPKIYAALVAGCALFFLNWWLLELPLPHAANTAFYIFTLTAGYLALLMSGLWMSRLYRHNFMEDVFNMENESFMQETRLMENEYSVNLPTRFYYKKRWNNGFVNIVNIFRACMVIGTPGSGKSYAIVNSYIRQLIAKGFAIYIYDYKFDDLSTIAYNSLLKNMDKYEVKPRFYVINFDDPRRSHRCNPINPEFMTDISDAYEASYTIMLNLNRTWIEKQGDFFVESPIILLAAIIWYLKIYKNGIYCTFPHAVELLNKPYSDLFTVLTSYPELENYLSPFMDAWKGGAQDQLQGQIASAKIPLTRMISPQLYWVMTGNDFSLDINNPKEPKLLCVGNNPDRQNIYSAALGLYNSRIVKLINKKRQLKCAVIIDELPTIYFRGLDNLIATARSNKVGVLLGFQDFSQLTRDYGEKESKVIQNTVGNIFSGQVVGETAKTLSERFGKVLQQRQSVSINRQDVSTSINTQLDSLIPASKIANLSQGTFVGAVADNFGEKIEQKIFHAEIVVDHAAVSAEEKAYRKIPFINEFKDKDGNDIMMQQIQRNYDQIKSDAQAIINEEMDRIKNDPELCKRLGLDNEKTSKKE